MNGIPRPTSIWPTGLEKRSRQRRAGGHIRSAWVSLPTFMLLLTMTGICHGEEKKLAKVRYLPEQRDLVKAFMNETTPSLKWRMDDEFLYPLIEEGKEPLHAAVFSTGPEDFEYRAFCVFVMSLAQADRDYDRQRAYSENSLVLICPPPKPRNFVFYIDSEPTFSRVYREVREKQSSALQHFSQVRKHMPNVLGLNVCFREEDVQPCFLLLEEFQPPSGPNPFWSGKAPLDRSPYTGFRSALNLPDTNPVWVEKWQDYYFVWRTRSLEQL